MDEYQEKLDAHMRDVFGYSRVSTGLGDDTFYVFSTRDGMSKPRMEKEVEKYTEENPPPKGWKVEVMMLGTIRPAKTT